MHTYIVCIINTNYSEVVPKPTRAQTGSYSDGPVVPKAEWFTRTQIFEYDFTSELVPTVFFGVCFKLYCFVLDACL